MAIYNFNIFTFIIILIINLNINIIKGYSTNTNNYCSNTFNINNNKAQYKANFSKFNYAAITNNTHQKQNLSLSATGKFNNFNPYAIIGITPKDYTLLYFDSLMIAPLDDINTFYPLIATSLCITTITPNTNNNFATTKLSINLNKAAQWHNNTPITANDIKFTIETAKTISLAYYKEILLNVALIEIINNYTIDIYLTTYNINTISLILSIPVISAEYWHNVNFTKPYNIIPLSSGPYTATVNKNIITYNKNNNYWANNLPSRKNMFTFNTIIVKYFLDPNSELLNALNGKVDIFHINPINAVNYRTSQILNTQQFNVIQTSNKFNNTFKAMFFNIKSPHLNNIETRKAILMLYNFNKINNNIYNGNFYFKNKLFINSYTNKNYYNYALAQNTLHTTYNKLPTLTIVFKEHQDIMLDWLNNLQQIGFKLNIVIANPYIYNNYLKNKNYDIIEGELLFANPPQFEIEQYFTNPHNNLYNLNNINYTQNGKSLEEINDELFLLNLFIPLPISQYMYYAVKKHIVPNVYGINNNIINIYNWTIN